MQMICDTEVEIVRKYVIESRQDRIIWELTKPEKRKHIMLRRFPGVALFKEDCLQEIKYLPPDELERKLFQLSKSRNTYFIGESHIGELTLREAVKRADMGDICIIYCGNGVGYYQGEEYGPPPRYILLERKCL